MKRTIYISDDGVQVAFYGNHGHIVTTSGEPGGGGGEILELEQGGNFELEQGGNLELQGV